MDDQAAIAELLQTVRETPADTTARMRLGQLYARTGDFANAIATLEWVAKSYVEAGALTQAVVAYKQVRVWLRHKAPDLQPRYAHVLPTLADLLQRLGRGDDAATVLAEIGEELKRERRDMTRSQSPVPAPVQKAAAAPSPAPPPTQGATPKEAQGPTRRTSAERRLAQAMRHTRPTAHKLEAVKLPAPETAAVAARPIAPPAILPPPPASPVVPVIETARLRLRGHRADDLAASAAMWADPVVTRHVGGRAFTEEEVWLKILRYAGLWPLLGFGYWVIEERTTGKFVGEVGFASLKREIVPSIGDAPEMGWALASSSHGLGYATEAVTAAATWGDAKWPGQKTVCVIEPGNLAAIGVARKAGYKGGERRTYNGAPVLVSFR